MEDAMTDEIGSRPITVDDAAWAMAAIAAGLIEAVVPAARESRVRSKLVANLQGLAASDDEPARTAIVEGAAAVLFAMGE